jgi:hypothetical protein
VVVFIDNYKPAIVIKYYILASLEVLAVKLTEIAENKESTLFLGLGGAVMSTATY